MYIEILYSNLNRQKVALKDIRTLSRDNVLFILISKPKLKNIRMCHGFDNYVVCTKRDWVMLAGYDEDDFIWLRANGNRVPSDPPLKGRHTIFRGKQVPNETWAKALKIFDKKMLKGD